MRIKTIIIIIITVLLTIVIVENNKVVNFEFLWMTFSVSKLIMLLIVALIAFILGILVGRPKRVIRLDHDADSPVANKNIPGTLSDEDKEYIN